MVPAHRFASTFALVMIAVALPLACGFPTYGGFDSGASSGGGQGGSTSASKSASTSPSTSASDSSATSAVGGHAAGGGGGRGGGGGGAGGSCTSNADCDANPNGHVCDIGRSTCVECVPTNDTCTTGTYCGTDDTCQPGCKSDADCNVTGGTGGLTCDRTNHACIGCATDDQCPPGLLCEVASTTCVPGCTPTHACQTGQTCCTDTCADLSTDANNCGACGTPCAPAHATGACVASACTVASCDSGYNDCNGTPGDGCESEAASDPNHCGDCATDCPTPANGVAGCQGGSCAVASCKPNFGDCDADPTNGCETNLLTSAMNCGGCGQPCSTNNGTPTCASGVCSIACDPQFKNCDNDVANGCEVNTTSNVNNCGTCGHICTTTTGTPACVAGGCTVSNCPNGTGDCNGTGSCSVNTTNDVNNCNGCGLACFVAHGTPACGGSMCYIAGCDPGFDDCDTTYGTGCEVNTQTSLANCGSCGDACTNAHGTTTCSLGVCAPVCSSGFGDCDANPSNGCEAALNSDPLNCGGCGVVCAFAHGAGLCQAGQCVLTSCNSGFDDCDTDPSNGCEVPLNSAANCGACGRTCTNANGPTSCVAGACVPVCNSGFDDCDANPNNGCETNTSTSTNNCGGCNQACSSQNGMASCAGGNCSIVCNAPYKDCNGNARADGCEANTNSDANHCGTCSTVCSGGTPACVGGTCSAVGCMSGHSDCDGNGGNGCECATPGCCGAGCQQAHDDGVGQNFYDCTAQGTHNLAQATEACQAFTGGVGSCTAFGCTGGGSNKVVCANSGSDCVCWNYSGSNVGRVHNPGSTSCFCPAGSDPTWN